jgi:hypothetical protein
MLDLLVALTPLTAMLPVSPQVPVVHPGQAQQGCPAVCRAARLCAGSAERVTRHQRRALQSDTRDAAGEASKLLPRVYHPCDQTAVLRVASKHHGMLAGRCSTR